MSDFKAKMHKVRFPLRLRHRSCWGSLLPVDATNCAKADVPITPVPSLPALGPWYPQPNGAPR